MRRVNHELLELVNSRGEDVENAFNDAFGEANRFSSKNAETEEYDDDIETKALLSYDSTKAVMAVPPVVTNGSNSNISSGSGSVSTAPTIPLRSAMRKDDAPKKTTHFDFDNLDDTDMIPDPSEGTDSPDYHNKSPPSPRTPPLDKRPSLKRVESRFKRSESTSTLFDLESQTEARSFASVEEHEYKKALTMVVTHLVKWEKILEFENWSKEMCEKM